ncbi:uncharacterized protein (DUF4415 family) [Methylorubrum rhodinum]|uniref:Uncharacterized protein (DUF4415 family) n=1 Tax=Methylorubrum rhodinum TaxID=29428 RepID=A0A840ZQG1_9HYPH|nr:uncharacterized protein (DUF4415 family) [Methylorubrum rhodinum]
MPSNPRRETATPRVVEMLSEEEEAALQVEIATDPDAPEATTEQLAQMRPAREAMPPALFKALTRRGRPRSPNKLVQVTLRLDPAALASFRATGPGWQGRINEAVIVGSRRLPQQSGADDAEKLIQQPQRPAKERAAKHRSKA